MYVCLSLSIYIRTDTNVYLYSINISEVIYI